MCFVVLGVKELSLNQRLEDSPRDSSSNRVSSHCKGEDGSAEGLSEFPGLEVLSLDSSGLVMKGVVGADGVSTPATDIHTPPNTRSRAVSSNEPDVLLCRSTWRVLHRGAVLDGSKSAPAVTVLGARDPGPPPLSKDLVLTRRRVPIR